jgi:hypothetical protein
LRRRGWSRRVAGELVGAEGVLEFGAELARLGGLRRVGLAGAGGGAGVERGVELAQREVLLAGERHQATCLLSKNSKILAWMRSVARSWSALQARHHHRTISLSSRQGSLGSDK